MNASQLQTFSLNSKDPYFRMKPNQELVDAYNMRGRNITIALAFGILGTLLLTSQTLSAFKVRPSFSRNTLLSLGAASSFLGFGSAASLALKQKAAAQNINRLSDALIREFGGKEFFLEKYELRDDTDSTTTEERERMKPFCERKPLQWEVRVTSKCTWQAATVAFFSAQASKLEETQMSQKIIEQRQEEYRSWRQLLKELTDPTCNLNVSDAERHVVGMQCYSNSRLNNSPQRSPCTNMTYSISENQGVNFQASNNSYLVYSFSSANDFRAFLRDKCAPIKPNSQ